MSGDHLRPSEGEHGLASYDVADLAELLLPAWDGFIRLADDVDLTAPSRVEGWSAHDVCVHLGSWPEHPSLQRMVQEARDGGYGGTPYDETRTARLVAAHADAPPDEVRQRLRDAREETAKFLRSSEPEELGDRLVSSVLGPLPLLTLVAAIGYELAVHGLDLGPTGAPAPTAELLNAGLASLTDTTGGLAVRYEIEATAACISPEGGWVFGSGGDAWTTMALPTVPTSWPAVEGSAAVLLDASAGRRAVPALLARRELRVHHVPGLLSLAPIVENVPGLPGGAALGGALRHLRSVGRLVRRLPGLHH